MKKTEKIALAIVMTLTLVNCSTGVAPVFDTSSPLIGRMQYAPTGRSSLVQDTSSHSLLTPHSSLNFSDLAKKYNFAELEKEYKSFSTKALSDSYVKRMFGKYLGGAPNSVQLTRQLEFSRYLKNNGDTSYETSLKNVFAETPTSYDSLTGNTDINQKMGSESATFGNYVIGLSPYPAVPLATSSTNIAATSFTANWNASNRATGYKLFVNGNEVYSGSNTSFSVTGLTTGATYNYYVKGFNNAGNSGNSNTVSVVLNPAVPVAPTTNAASNITQTSFTANWNTVSGATSYKLKVDSGVYTDVGNVSSSNVTGLTAGTTHTYSVQAANISGTSAASSNRSVTLLPATPPAPVATIASNLTATSFRANWNSVSGATSYKLFIDGAEAYTGTALYYNKTGVLSGSTHTYYVQAINSGGTSGNSNEISVSLLTHLTNIQSFISFSDWDTFTVGANTYITGAASPESKIYKWNVPTSQFTEIQSLPTGGIHDIQTFKMGTDTYLVSGIYNDGGYNATSVIYKWNNSTEKFQSVQSISTSGVTDWEHFVIGTDNYLAVANSYNGSHNISSIIYKRNTSTGLFEQYQAVSTSGAYDWEHFVIGTEHYLAVANHYSGSYSIDSVIYKWNNSTQKFDDVAPFQSIGTVAGYNLKHFMIGADNYIAAANNYSNSYVYKWNTSTGKFNTTPLQTITTSGAYNWEYFTVGSDSYLAIANYSANSNIYKWNGTQFDTTTPFQSIPTNGAFSLKHFMIGTIHYLAVANSGGDSIVYRID